ncbi:hypothetical protein SK128_024764, partial [Halocaridina rubra]
MSTIYKPSLAQCRSQAPINGESFQDSPSKTLEDNLFAQATHGWPNLVSQLTDRELSTQAYGEKVQQLIAREGAVVAQWFSVRVLKPPTVIHKMMYQSFDARGLSIQAMLGKKKWNRLITT